MRQAPVPCDYGATSWRRTGGEGGTREMALTTVIGNHERASWRKKAVVASLVLGIALVVWAQREAKAAVTCTKYWTGAVSNTYSTGGNWNTAADGSGATGAPGATAGVCEANTIVRPT